MQLTCSSELGRHFFCHRGLVLSCNLLLMCCMQTFRKYVAAHQGFCSQPFHKPGTPRTTPFSFAGVAFLLPYLLRQEPAGAMEESAAASCPSQSCPSPKPPVRAGRFGGMRGGWWQPQKGHLVPKVHTFLMPPHNLLPSEGLPEA